MASTRHAALFVPVLGILAIVTRAASAASFVAIGPFAGGDVETFEGFPQGAHQTLHVFAGAATISNLTEPEGSLKIEFSSSLGGNLVTPRSGTKMGGQLGIAEWVFDPPPRRFGGYFATNSGADDAIITFFGENDEIIGTEVLTAVNVGNIWSWNGWEFSVPVRRLEIDGNGLVDGFIWYDDMELSPLATAVPATSEWGLAVLVVLVGTGLALLRPGAQKQRRAS